ASLNSLSDHATYVRMTVIMCILALYIVYVAWSTWLFAKRTAACRELVHRPVPLLLAQTAGCLLLGIYGLLCTALPQFPCFVQLWLLTIGLTLLMIALAARATQLIIMAKMHQVKSQLAALGGVGMTHACSQITPADSSAGNQSSARLSEFAAGPGPSPADSMHLAPVLRKGDYSERIRLHTSLMRCQRVRKLTSDSRMKQYAAVLLMCMFIMTLLINILSPKFSLIPTNTECGFVWGIFPIIAIYGTFLVIVVPALLIMLWSVEDVYGIKADLAICAALTTLCLVLMIVWNVKLVAAQEAISSQFFVWLSACVLHFMSISWPVIRARRLATSPGGDAWLNAQQYKSQAASGDETLSPRQCEFFAMLESDIEYERFRRYAAACFCSELTAFLDEYQILKYCTVHALEQRASFVRSRSPTNVNDIYDKLVGDRERNRPLRLYTHVTVGILETVSAVFPAFQFSKDSFFPSTIAYVYVSLVSTYIHPESHLAINVPGHIADDILDKLHKREMTLGALDTAKDEVLRLLYTDVYLRYCSKQDRVDSSR
ncbi:hypothetical protein EC988_000993, partial [Linderina pennispora]